MSGKEWLTPHLVDAFSGMVTKKGRFGTDPYIKKKRTPKPKTLSLGERIRVRDEGKMELCTPCVGKRIVDSAPCGCLFGYGYKEGSVWNRPLH